MTHLLIALLAVAFIGWPVGAVIGWLMTRNTWPGEYSRQWNWRVLLGPGVWYDWARRVASVRKT